MIDDIYIGEPSFQYAHPPEYHRLHGEQCKHVGTSVTFDLGALLLPRFRAVYLDML